MAGAAAAEAELPAAEARRWLGRHGEHTNHSQEGEEVRCLDGLSQMPERNEHAHTSVSSAHALQHGVADLPQLIWQLTDRPEAGGGKRRREDRGRDAVMGAADDLQRQASNSSQQEQSQSNNVRRIMGLETRTAEKEEMERKRQFEAVRPEISKSGRCGRRRRWKISSQRGHCTGFGQGETHQKQVAGRPHRRRSRGEVEASCHRGGVRKQRRLFCGYSPR